MLSDETMPSEHTALFKARKRTCVRAAFSARGGNQ